MSRPTTVSLTIKQIYELQMMLVEVTNNSQTTERSTVPVSSARTPTGEMPRIHVQPCAR